MKRSTSLSTSLMAPFLKENTMFLAEPSSSDSVAHVAPYSVASRSVAPRRRFFSSAVLTLGLLTPCGLWNARPALASMRPTVDNTTNPGLPMVTQVGSLRTLLRVPLTATLTAALANPQESCSTGVTRAPFDATSMEAGWLSPTHLALNSQQAALTPIQTLPQFGRQRGVVTPAITPPTIAAPRARLMPRAAQFIAADFPAPGAVPQIPPATPAPAAAAPAQATAPQPVESNAGGGKMIQFNATDKPSADATAQSVNGMKKIIDVPTLTLPPLSQPLPAWMQAASVRVERLEKPSKAGDKNGTRVAQNPNAAPVRQPGSPVTNSDRLSNQIEVSVSTFVVLLTTTDLQTVAVADPNIADVAVVNSRSVLLNGKSPGTTSLVIVDGQKIRQYSVHVTEAVGQSPKDVAEAIGIPGVTVRPLKDALVLEGEVGTPEESKHAEEIAGIYAAKVVNQIVVRPTTDPNDALLAQMRQLIDIPGVTVSIAGDTIALRGQVADPSQISDAETLAATSGKKVVNLLKLPTITVDAVRQALGATDQAPTGGLSIPGQLSVPTPMTVRELGGSIILEGSVDSQADIDIAMATAKRSGLPIVNRLQVRPAATQDQALVSAVAAAIGRPGVIVRGTAHRLVLEGSVADTNEAVLAEQVARGFITGNGQVDNLLKTSQPVQVNVDVKIAEINSNAARTLGVEYGSAAVTAESATSGSTTPVRDAAGNPVIDAGGNVVTQTSPGSVTRTINPTFNSGSFIGGNGFAGFGTSGPNGALGFIDPFRFRLNALINDGKARILSAPSTTVLSGRTATFQVGGQVPIPASTTVGAAGQTTGIVFKDYGILLDIVPVALQNGVVTLRVRTEVSQPDFANGVTPPGGGSVIPGFSRRATVTEVTVPPSGVLSLSGLIRSEDTKAVTGLPILSKLPIIGSLFKSKDFRENKTELVIFVQPHVLANPLPEGETSFASPFAVGENTNVAAQMGNPGLHVFDGGTSDFAPATTGGGQ